MTVEEVAARFGAKKVGKEWLARCPVHKPDSNPSVGITQNGTRVLVHCRAGCPIDALLAAVGLTMPDLFLEPKTAQPPPARKVVATYDYHDPSGKRVCQVVRYEPKGFSQRHEENGQWVWSLNGVDRYPYRLPELLSADPEDPVFLVEGEKDADALANERLIATTTLGGAGGWREDYAPHFVGRKVFILPDNDDSGRAYAAKAAASLKPIAAAVRTLELPGLPRGGDVSDWLKTHTVTEIFNLIYAAPGPKGWPLDELAEADIPEPDTFLGELLARGSVLLLAGRRGSGKTYLTLAWAAAIALGRPLGHLDCRQGKVLYLSQEMGTAAIRKRIRRLFPDPGERAMIGKRLITVCKAKFKLDSDQSAELMRQMVAHYKPDVVFLDALRDVRGGYKENSNDDMGDLMVRLRDSVAEAFSCGVVLLHHKGKPGDEGQDRGSRGASALEDVAEDVIYLKADKHSPRRTGDFEKTREGTLEGKSFWYEISSAEDNPNIVTLSVGDAGIDEDSNTDISRAKELAGVLNKEGAMTKKEIRRRMSWTESTMTRAIRTGLKADLLARIPAVQGRGNEARFDIHERFKLVS